MTSLLVAAGAFLNEPDIEMPWATAFDPGDVLADRFGCLVQCRGLADRGRDLYALQGPPLFIWLSFDRVHRLSQQAPFPGVLELHI